MRRLARFLSLVLALGLSACASLAPSMGLLPATPELTPPAVTMQSAAGWRALGDPVLDDLIAQALAANHDVLVAMTRVEAARAELGLARQAYWPEGAVVGTRSETRLSQHQAPGVPRAARRTSSDALLLEAGWEIDLSGRLHSASVAARAGLARDTALLAAARLSVAHAVAATWYDLRAARASQAVSERRLADQRQVVHLTRELVAEGELAEEALALAAAEAAREAGVASRSAERARALENALAVLLGAMPGTWRAPEAVESGALSLPLVLADVGAQIAARPDVRAAEAAARAANAGIGTARAAWLPQLAVRGELGWVAGEAGALGRRPSETWRVTPSLTWNLLDLFRTAERVAVADAEARAARARWEQRVLEAVRETDDAFRHLEGAGARLALAAERLSQAERAARAAQARYAEGLAAYRDALDARREAAAAELAAVEALAEQRGAVLGVLKALGTAPG